MAIWRTRFFPRRPIITILFTIDAPAVLLAIHAPTTGFINSRFPPISKILVEKGDTDGFANGFADGLNLIMLLEATVQQGAREGVEPAFFRIIGSGGQTVVITVCTALGFAKGHIAHKGFHFITGLVDHFQINGNCVILKGLLALHAFRIGVDIVAVKKAHDRMVIIAQNLERVNTAGRAADMH